MFRKLAKPTANADNLMEPLAFSQGCCPDADLTECKYRFTIPNASTITGITLTDASGTSVAKTLTSNLGVTADGATTLVRALKVLIESAGYVNDANRTPAYRITASGSNTIVDFFGEAVIASIQRTSGGNLTPTVTCNRVGKCTFTLVWPGSADSTTFTVNSVDATLAAHEIGTDSAATLKAAIEALANWPAAAVLTVTEDSEAYTLSIYYLAMTRFSLDGDSFSQSDCKPDYI